MLFGNDDTVREFGWVHGDLREVLTGLDIKEPDLAEPVAGHKDLGVRQRDNLRDYIALLDATGVGEALTINRPEGGGAVVAAAQQATIRRKNDGLNGTAMRGPVGHALPRL